MEKLWIILGIVAIFLLAAVPLFTFLIYRRYKIDKYKKIKDSWFFKLENDTNNRYTTLKRFKFLVKNQPNLSDKVIMLERLDETMDQLRIKIKISLQDASDLEKKYKVFELKKMFKNLDSIFKKYENSSAEFEELSQTTNLHWNIIENVAESSFDILKYTENYIERNQNYLINSKDEILNKIIQFKRETANLEEEKLKKNISQVSNQLNENEKKIINFVKKVDRLKKFEFIIFKYLPNELNTMKNSNNFDANEIDNLIQRNEKIKKDFVYQHYQTTQNELRKILFRIYFLKIKNKEKEKISDFIPQILIKMNVLLDDLHKEIKKRQNWFNKINFDKIISLLSGFKKVISLEIDNKQNQITSLEKLQNFLNETIDFIEKINKFILEEQKQANAKLYFLNYSQISYELFLKTFKDFELLEKTNANEKLNSDLLKAHKLFDDFKEQIYRNKEKSGRIDFEKILQSEFWKEKEKLLLEAFKKSYKAYLYKEMTNQLLENSYFLRHNNEKFINLIEGVNKFMKTKNYEQAYELLSNYLKKEKRYVR
ncbi:hypothetical protein MCSF7_01606 [Mycoplasmopsis columbina SF7]|uniref:Septation ring formation regulator EzrA n=1 Tax=Mycoplasmopsis columbina SF7 TaxID=1037410 RepID=F9UKB0_9BACT|nr:hypothetical protein [Mycoplasmopsis columbina]EGV00115.1 hypothetical protein MCSF7_01606 [Mycoplasmopsis columbina SF7]